MSGGGFGYGISGLLNRGLNAIEPLIFGAADPFVLGPVVLTDFEIPEHVNFGGAQKLTVHTLPGGERVIDAMGREDDSPSWTGVFLGPDAMDRAKQWDVLRAKGDRIQLIWGTLSYTVVIESFQPDYKQQYHVPYKITCKVLIDNAAPIPDNTVSADQAVSNDVSTATDAAPEDAPQTGITKTTVETGPSTTATQTYQPIEQTAPTVANANAAAGNNLPTSVTSMVDLGPPSSLAGATPATLSGTTAAAQSAADSEAITTANASLFTGT